MQKVTKYPASNRILGLSPENHSRKVQGRLPAPPPPNPVSLASFRRRRTGGGAGDEDEHRSPWRKGSRVPWSVAQSLRGGGELREILCEGIGAQEGVGEQEVVPRGAIQAHSRVEYLFRVRAAPSGDQDCPAKAIVLPPSPQSLPGPFEPEVRYFFSLPTSHQLGFSTQELGWRPGMGRWGEGQLRFLRKVRPSSCLTVRGTEPGPQCRSYGGRGNS